MSHKFLVLLEERKGQFKNKMMSPLFRGHFDDENWKLLYFDTLGIVYTKQKSGIDIYRLLSKMTKPSREKNPPNTQGRLF